MTAAGNTDGQATSVVDRLHRSVARMTPAERRVGRALIAGYPVAGLSTVADLAAASSASSATVVRLVQKLGFDGFPQFQLAIRDELASRTSGPGRRIGRGGLAWDQPGSLARMTAAANETVASVAETVPEAEFDAAVRLLSDQRRGIRLIGGRVTGLLAEYLGHHLERARPQVRVIDTSPRWRHAALLGIERRDTLVAFDVKRYDSDLSRFVGAAAERGAAVVLITDVLMSPVASVAEVVLPVRVEAPSPFDTTVGVLVIIEALASAVVATIGTPAATRIRAWDDLADQATR